MRLKFVPTLLGLLLTGALCAQKKPITQQDYDQWKSVGNTVMSNNGDWAYYTVNPQRGDGALYMFNTNTNQTYSFERGTTPTFFDNAQWVSFTIKAPFEAARNAKIGKLKDDKTPKDTLAIVNLKTMNVTKFPKAKSLKTAENGSTIAYTYEIKQANTTADSVKKRDIKFDRLVIMDLSKGDSILVDSVKNFAIAKSSDLIIYSKESDSLKAIYAYVLDDKNGTKQTKLFESTLGTISPNFALSQDGTQAAFLATSDTMKHALYDLYYFSTKEGKTKIINPMVANMPKGYAVSRFGHLNFNIDGTRLQFGIAPKPKEVPKPTPIPDDEKYALDIWSWHDTIIQPQQIANPKQISEANYVAAFFPKENRALALGDYNLKSIRWAEDSNAPYALGTDSNPYSLYTKDEIPPYDGTDVYLIDLKTGARTLIQKNNFAGIQFSPSAKYAAYYQPQDSSWYSINTKTLAHTRLTASIPYPLWVEDDDHAAEKAPYGFYGWIEGSDNFLIGDRFDIWMINPSGKVMPENVTQIGRKKSIRFRINNLGRKDGKYAINANEPIILRSLNTENMDNGFYALNIGRGVTKLIEGPYGYSIATYARESDRIIFRRSSFREYGDLWISNRKFSNPQKITTVNPQQESYKWGDVTLISWPDFNGVECKGLLYTPDNYDPTKRYPTIVFFYEKQTSDMHNYNTPAPSRNIISTTYCTSNGYVVFVPDVSYKVGIPGKSCYDAVISGTMSLIEKGIADPKRIGLQGHSWGGYQTAYLVTQTDIFACCSPNAIVSNMTSAYGGIRWGSGNPRTFQYETGQSRVGATLWQRRDLYIENSPLFSADKVNTPILMMHNDADEAVPWYQGIEFYLALRRMAKPVWMLNYNKEAHNLNSRTAALDWDRRMYQFFDHYLKDAPPPRWMSEGRSIIEKDVDQKYELTK